MIKLLNNLAIIDLDSYISFRMILTTIDFLFFKILFIYFQREGKGGRKRGRTTSMCGCPPHAPHWGPGLQPRHMPWPGIKPVTLWFTGQCSIHWATPARATVDFQAEHIIIFKIGCILCLENRHLLPPFLFTIMQNYLNKHNLVSISNL